MPVRRKHAACGRGGKLGGPELAILRKHNYRLFIISQVVANTGVWVQRLAQDWLVLSLTGSVTAIGVNAALQFGPVVVFGLLGGVFADRYSRRILLMATQLAGAVLAGVLGFLTLSGDIRVGHVYAVSFALGVVAAVDNPARAVFIPELVGHPHLRPALSLNASVFQLGAVAGPALGGVVIHTFGEGWAFAANAVACAFVVLMLGLVREDLLHREPALARARGQLREGVRYVRDTPAVLWAVILAATVGFLTQNMSVVVAGFAKVVFHTGPGGFAAYNTVLAVGGVLGAALAARRGAIRLRTLVMAAMLLGLALVATAMAPAAVFFAAGLLAVGTASLLFLIDAVLLVQLATERALVGRVLALYIMALLGGRAVGGPVVGLAIEELGVRLALLVLGSAMFLASLGIGVILAHTGSLRLVVRLRGRRRNCESRSVIAIIQATPVVRERRDPSAPRGT